MPKRIYCTLTLFTLLTSVIADLQADNETAFKPTAETSEISNPASDSSEPFEPFTGRITRNKVRMRLHPSLDAPILHELPREELMVVLGEADDFYSVAPPKDSKAYVFRTFVLDRKIEGNKVNVRLEPALEAPVIAQLNSGDEIDGIVSPLNSKWLEITPPPSTRFYVCKEYVEKIGDPSVMAQIEKRREEVNELLNNSYQISQSELQKNYEEMEVETALAGYRKIINEYNDFHDQSARAKELLGSLQETVLERKIAYLEAKTTTQEAALKNSYQPNGRQQKEREIQGLASKGSLPADGQPLQNRETTENQPSFNGSTYGTALPTGAKQSPQWEMLFDSRAMTGKMANWLPVEKALYDHWAKQKTAPSVERFYTEQMEEAVTLTGVLEPYSRSLKNKPGDFLLVSTANSLPIAYLYSTSVNLQEHLGQVTTIHAVRRSNNNFAFPAYFVISIE